MKREKKCLALFSGGLDSILVVIFMQKLGYKVIPIFFETPFFTSRKAEISARKNGIKLEIIDITEQHLQMLLEPKYGYGKNMNPCIDCHGLMFKNAGKLLKKYDAHFIISGEVLGQRPMSQRFDALNSVGNLSEVKDLLIRPLSQKLLADTKPIREGWVKKEEMLDIQGRNRQRQMQMVKEYEITKFPSPDGGCLLTDAGFSKKLKDLVEHNLFNSKSIEFIKIGRHLRINKELKLIIGRNKQENESLSKLVTDEIVMQTFEISGPFGVIQNLDKLSDEDLKICAGILLRYNSKVDEKAEVIFGLNFKLKDKISANKMKNEEVKKYLI